MRIQCHISYIHILVCSRLVPRTGYSGRDKSLTQFAQSREVVAGDVSDVVVIESCSGIRLVFLNRDYLVGHAFPDIAKSSTSRWAVRHTKGYRVNV